MPLCPSCQGICRPSANQAASCSGSICIPRVTLGLADLARHVDVQALGFDRRDRRETGEEQVVGALLALSRPFGNRQVSIAIGPGTLCMREPVGVGLLSELDARIARVGERPSRGASDGAVS